MVDISVSQFYNHHDQNLYSIGFAVNRQLVIKKWTQKSVLETAIITITRTIIIAIINNKKELLMKG